MKLLFALLLISQYAHSSSIFNININDYGGANATQQAAIDTVVRDLEAKVRAELPDADVSTYLNSTSNALMMAGKGTGTDYANNFDVFVTGINAGVGIDTGGQSLNSFLKGDADIDNVRGAGIQGAVMVGANVGRFIKKENWGLIKPKNLDVFMHAFQYNYDTRDDDSLFRSRMTNFGFHARYRLHQGKKLMDYNLLRWGGVKLHTGYQYAKMNLLLENNFNEDVSSSGFSGTFEALARADVDVTTHSIPIEVSTDLQLLYFLTLYTGVGADISLGRATAVSNLSNSDLTISGGGITASGTASLNLGDRGKPSLTQLRGFFGAQINILNFKLFAQLDQSFIHDLYGLSFGARFAY